MNQKISILYTTVASKEDAENLSEQAIIAKLAACVNIIPNATSMYEWNGKLEKTSEFLIIFKTSDNKIEKLYQWILNNHPYDVPAILKTLVDTSVEFYSYVNNM